MRSNMVIKGLKWRDAYVFPNTGDVEACLTLAAALSVAQAVVLYLDIDGQSVGVLHLVLMTGSIVSYKNPVRYESRLAI